jgi:hypothetical protein
MGNTASATLFTRPESSHWDSDVALDQMEKQTIVDNAAAASSWAETAACYCAVALSMMAALLVGNFTGSLEQPDATPILVDAACQTEGEVFQELTVNRDWQPCHVDSKCDADDDSHSFTTESTEVFTDAESEDYEQDFDDNESDWESLSSAADDLLRDICDACESCADGDSESQAEQLLRLTSVVCAEEEPSGSTYLGDYLCTCGECPHYKEIADDVSAGAKTLHYNAQQARSIIRLLQGFSTYNEVVGYHADMIPAARECLRIWSGDEEKAFKSLVTLYDEVPQLCGAQ